MWKYEVIGCSNLTVCAHYIKCSCPEAVRVFDEVGKQFCLFAGPGATHGARRIVIQMSRYLLGVQHEKAS